MVGEWTLTLDRLFIHILPSIIWAIGLFIYASRDMKEWKRKLVPLFVYAALMVANFFFHFFDKAPFYRFLSLFILFVWFLVLNYRNVGLSLFAWGGIFNAVVSLVNRGRMPVMDNFEMTEIHQPMTSDTIFPFLADWILSPYGFYQVSFGDVLLAVGGLVFLSQEIWFLYQIRKSRKK